MIQDRIQSLLAANKALVEALTNEMAFREECRNADPSIEDRKAWSATDSGSRQALANNERMMEKG